MGAPPLDQSLYTPLSLVMLPPGPIPVYAPAPGHASPPGIIPVYAFAPDSHKDLELFFK